MKIVDMEQSSIAVRLRNVFTDHDYWHVIFLIGLPVAVQNLFSSGLNLIDSIMVGRLGDSALASVGIANTVFFLMIVFMFGIGSGTGIFIAQYFGRKDMHSVGVTMAVGFIVSLISSLFFMVVTLLFASEIMSFFSSDAQVVALGVVYMKIVAFSYPLSALANLFYSGLRSIKRAVLPLLVSAVAIITNTVLNYLLIYGIGIFPRMGVKGAAIATLIARVVEIILVILVIYAKKIPIAVYWQNFKAITSSFLKEIMGVTMPVFLNEGLWALGATTYTLLWSQLGTTYMAGFNILQTINRLTFSLSMGMAAATAAMVGHKIGEGQLKKAYQYAGRTNILGAFLGGIIGLLLLVFSRQLTNFFDVSPEAKEYAVMFIRVCAVIVPLMTFNLVNLLGALRGGGDTRFAFWIDILPMWLFAIPLSFLAGWKFAWPLPVVFLLTTSDEIFKGIFGLKRFLSRRWIHEMKSVDDI